MSADTSYDADEIARRLGSYDDTVKSNAMYTLRTLIADLEATRAQRDAYRDSATAYAQQSAFTEIQLREAESRADAPRPEAPVRVLVHPDRNLALPVVVEAGPLTPRNGVVHVYLDNLEAAK